MFKNRFLLFIFIITLIFFFLLVSVVFAGERQITTNTSSQANPAIYGDTIVWEDSRNGTNNTDIYTYNLLTNTERQITTNISNQQNSAVYKNKIVWQDNRNNNNYDIYTFDLSTNTERRITTVGNTSSPSIYEEKIVWQDRRNGNYDVYMYSFNTNSQMRITTNSSDQNRPAIYGDKIVWQDYRNGNSDIYMYNLSTNTESRITTNEANQIYPSIYENKIVWQDSRNGNTDIYMFDLSTNTEKPISTDIASQYKPVIDNNKIVWQDYRNGNWNIYLYDLSTNTESQITTDGASQREPAIYGDKIVWQDERNVNSDIYIYEPDNNNPPVADAGGPYSGNEGSLINFNGANSYDPDPDDSITNYEWDLDNDGIFEIQNNPIPSYIFSDNGNYQVTLRVTDEQGNSSTDTATVNISNVSPSIYLIIYPQILIYPDLFEITVYASDPGTNDTLTYSFDWENDGTYDLVQSNRKATYQYTTVGSYTVKVKVQDDDGGYDEKTRQVDYQYNIPPVADAGGPYETDKGQGVILDGSGSYDDPQGRVIITIVQPPNLISSYEWDLNNDGQTDYTTGIVNLTWQDLVNLGISDYGEHIITLKVIDDRGETDIDTTTLTIRQLIKNNSFEIDDDLNGIPDDWTPANFAPDDGRSTDFAKEGFYSLKITSESKLKKITQRIEISGNAGDSFNLSGWNKNIGTTYNGKCIRAYIYLNNTDGTSTLAYIPFSRSSHDWIKGSVDITANKDYSSVNILIANANQTGVTYFDDFMLVKQ